MNVSISKVYNLLKGKNNGKTLCENLRVDANKFDKRTEPASEYARIGIRG